MVQDDLTVTPGTLSETAGDWACLGPSSHTLWAFVLVSPVGSPDFFHGGSGLQAGAAVLIKAGPERAQCGFHLSLLAPAYAS